MNKINILIKTRGGHKEGMGDVTSSLAIAEEFRTKGCVVEFIINNNIHVKSLISKNKYHFYEIQKKGELEKILKVKIFEIVIMNQLNSSIKEAILLKAHSKMLVTIEDTGQCTEFSDLRFNVLYPIPNSIIDFNYMPLSESFRNKHNSSKIIKKKVKKILITQGGSDTFNFTPKIMKSLKDLDEQIEVNVIVGPNFKNIRELEEIIGKSKRSFNLIKGINDLSEIMLESDLAISAGGNTLFELACLGIPTIVVCAEKFEIITAERLKQTGFCNNLGFGKNIVKNYISNSVNELINNLDKRKQMSKIGKGLVDGDGVTRMINRIIEEYINKCEIRKNQ